MLESFKREEKHEIRNRTRTVYKHYKMYGTKTQGSKEPSKKQTQDTSIEKKL